VQAAGQLVIAIYKSLFYISTSHTKDDPSSQVKRLDLCKIAMKGYNLETRAQKRKYKTKMSAGERRYTSNRNTHTKPLPHTPLTQRPPYHLQ